MCGHKMPVSGEESETEMASENGEPTAPEEGAQDFAFKNKYKELKGRLKYLVYVSRQNRCAFASVLSVVFPPSCSGTRVLRVGTAQSRADATGAVQGQEVSMKLICRNLLMVIKHHPLLFEM